MRNEGLRKEIKAACACIWEIAEYMGVSEMTVQRRLRKELSEGEVEEFITAAKKIAVSKAELKEA